MKRFVIFLFTLILIFCFFWNIWNTNITFQIMEIVITQDQQISELQQVIKQLKTLGQRTPLFKNDYIPERIEVSI